MNKVFNLTPREIYKLHSRVKRHFGKMITRGRHYVEKERARKDAEKRGEYYSDAEWDLEWTRGYMFGALDMEKEKDGD